MSSTQTQTRTGGSQTQTENRSKDDLSDLPPLRLSGGDPKTQGSPTQTAEKSTSTTSQSSKSSSKSSSSSQSSHSSSDEEPHVHFGAPTVGKTFDFPAVPEKPFDLDTWRGDNRARASYHDFVTKYFKNKYDTSDFEDKISRWAAELTEQYEYTAIERTPKGIQLPHWSGSFRELAVEADWVARCAQMPRLGQTGDRPTPIDINAASVEWGIRDRYEVPSDLTDLASLGKSINDKFWAGKEKTYPIWDKIMDDTIASTHKWKQRERQLPPTTAHNLTSRPKSDRPDCTLDATEYKRRVEHLNNWLKSDAVVIPSSSAGKAIHETQAKDLVWESKASDTDEQLQAEMLSLIKDIGGSAKGETGTKTQRWGEFSQTEYAKKNKLAKSLGDQSVMKQHSCLYSQIKSIWQTDPDAISGLARALIHKSKQSTEFGSLSSDEQADWFREKIMAVGARNKWDKTSDLYGDKYEGDTLYSGFVPPPTKSRTRLLDSLDQEFWLDRWGRTAATTDDDEIIRKRKERFWHTYDRIKSNWQIPDYYVDEDIEVLASRFVDELGTIDFGYEKLDQFTDETLDEEGWTVQPGNTVVSEFREKRKNRDHAAGKSTNKKFAKYNRTPEGKLASADGPKEKPKPPKPGKKPEGSSSSEDSDSESERSSRSRTKSNKSDDSRSRSTSRGSETSASSRSSSVDSQRSTASTDSSVST